MSKLIKTSTLSLVQFKKSLVALTVFEPSNEDVLLALKTEKTNENSPLHQNAMAEILFARLPHNDSRIADQKCEQPGSKAVFKDVPSQFVIPPYYKPDGLYQ